MSGRLNQVLAAAGVAIPKNVLVETRTQIEDVALGGRVVMKAIAPELNHKTESGAVLLGVEGARKWWRLMTRSRPSVRACWWKT